MFRAGGKKSASKTWKNIWQHAISPNIIRELIASNSKMEKNSLVEVGEENCALLATDRWVEKT